MLLTLPTEVILSIASLLDFRTKLRLNATCKKLNDLISKTNLYESLDFNDYRINFERAIEEFGKKPFKGAQVKTLQLKRTGVSEEMMTQLSRIFPKVTRFRYPNFRGSNNYEQQPISEPLATWINTLETYNAKTDWNAIWYALQRYPFPRLTVIEIEKDKNDFMQTSSGLFFMPSIKSAPSLKKLTLKHCGWTLDFLEDLHASSTQLESLRFEFCFFKINSNTLPDTIIPATSVLYLEISDLICFDANGLLLDYIAKKYPNLQRLRLTLEVSKHHIASIFDDYYPGSYYYFNSNDSDDSDDDDDDDDDIPITRNEYDKWFSDLTSAFATYRVCLSSFLPSLPKSVKSLNFNVESFDNTIEALVKSDLKLMELECCRTCGPGDGRLEDANHIFYLSHFPSLKRMTLAYKPTPHLLNHQGPISTSITKLLLQMEGNPLHIDWLLEAFPSLESLHIMGDFKTIVKVGDEAKLTCPRTINSSLQKLVIDHLDFQAGVFDYIKTVAPNVKELNLTVNRETEPVITKEEMVQPHDLSGWDLEKCSIHFYNLTRCTEKRYCKLTIEDTTTRCVFSDRRTPIRFQDEPFDFINLKIVVYLDIKCDNIKRLMINGALVKKIGDKITVTR